MSRVAATEALKLLLGRWAKQKGIVFMFWPGTSMTQAEHEADTLRLLAMLCVLAAGMGVAGDVCLLAYAQTDPGSASASWRYSVLNAGALIGVVAVLTHAPTAGWIVARTLPHSVAAKACFWLGLADAVIAAFVHARMASTLAVCEALGARGILSPCSLEHAYAPTNLGLLLLVGVVAVSVCFVVAVLSTAENLPRWLVFANPAVLMLACAAFGSVSASQARAILFLAPSLGCFAFSLVLLRLLAPGTHGDGRTRLRR